MSFRCIDTSDCNNTNATIMFSYKRSVYIIFSAATGTAAAAVANEPVL